MKGKKQREKVIPRCYRRNLSRTLSNSSTSQLIQLGSYKKRINALSRNNRLLATDLQDSRVEIAILNNKLQNYAKSCNNILFARIKLNEMTKNVSKLVTDLEEVRGYLTEDKIIDININNPFAHKRGLSNEKRICKEPAVNCIEEVTEEFSESEIAVAPESPSAVPDPVVSQKCDLKKSEVLPSNPGGNVEVINEDIMVAPILFADAAEEKVKRSTRSRSSRKAYDPDKGSLTPELNADLTSVKLKRSSSRRQTQFRFPSSSSRPASRERNTPSSKDNSPVELITPVKPASIQFSHYEQNVMDMEKHIEELLKSPIKSNIGDKNSINPNDLFESHSKFVFDSDQCVSFVPTANSEKNLNAVAVTEVQPMDSNHTVFFGDDMELTEVIRPVIEVALPLKPTLEDSHLTRDNTKVTEENDFSTEAENNRDAEILPEKENLEAPNPHPGPSKLHSNDDDIRVPEINEEDEVQNVGMITFCEPNVNDKDNANRATKSSLVKSCRAKPVKYAVFFSSDESDDDSPFKFIPKKGKTSKSKTEISSTKNVKSCGKTESAASQHKASSKDESKKPKNDVLKCTVDTLHGEKKKKKSSNKLSRKARDEKSSTKRDLSKQSTQKSKDCKLNKNESVKQLLCFSPLYSPGSILKNTDSRKVNATPLNKSMHDNLETSFEKDVETPRSESKKVSFAPTDLVCNFSRMSVSKEISGNKKLRRTSKSVLDFEELLASEAQTKAPPSVGADNFSESTNNKKSKNDIVFNFSDDTEMYTFSLPLNANFPTIPTADDLMMPKRAAASSNAPPKNVNDAKHSKKVLPASKSTKGKNADREKEPQKNVERMPQHTSGKLIKEKFKEKNGLLLESPVSMSKPMKRKSLFKEDLAACSKENVHSHHLALEKPETTSLESEKTNLNKNSKLLTENKCNKKSLGTKCQRKVSAKKVSDRPSTPEMKKKKYSVAMKSHENSPVLKDTSNLPDVQDGRQSKRKSKLVSYKEPSLTKKMRRE